MTDQPYDMSYVNNASQPNPFMQASDGLLWESLVWYTADGGPKICQLIIIGFYNMFHN